jgi:ketosteroid isomerase-like protein
MYGQQKPARDPVNVVLNLENEWTGALISKDEGVFNRFLADDFVYTENDKQYSKQEVIKSLVSPVSKVVSAHNEDMKVVVRDHTAVVTGWMYVNGTTESGEFKKIYRFTDVWSGTGDQWQLIAAQDYLMPE